jgi:DNA invertase Pin-like site-specific DNA recombinase
MIGEQKITSEHLARKAIVYLRQSSEGQVRNNLESQRLQYALAERAKRLGFHEVETIDTDLGASAAVAAKRREGFERLLAAVALGGVGLILSRELSRLLRTDRDFCQLVELCQLFGTLIGDEETIYDASSMDDQLVLGIKATMSVVELKVLRMRLAQGKENKARRGELYPRLPPGYAWDATKKIVKDPNLRVQEAIALVFSKFRETWSIRQTFKWFRDNGVELPVSRARGGRLDVVFQVPRLSFVQDVLHNPFYAGAYAWGRRPTSVVWRDGVLRKRQRSPKPPEEARVFIRDHHEGYLDWATFEENQRMIRQNDQRRGADETVGAVRAGRGLLVGLLRCGRCGRKLHVRYAGRSGTTAYYLCSGDFGAGGSRYCVGVSGAVVDRRVSDELLRVLSPLGIAASIEAVDRLAPTNEGKRRTIERQLTQLEYEATRSGEQYHAVDARNRLVAAELERRWNEKLEELARVRESLAALDALQQAPSAEERRALTAFGDQFADAWNHAACPIELKKQILRTVVEELIVDQPDSQKVAVIVHWKGGCHTRFEIDKAAEKARRRTSDEDVDVIRKMATRYGDDEIARALNKLGRRTATGKPWSASSVKSVRLANDIPGRKRAATDPDLLGLNAAARHAKTSNTTIIKLVNAGILPMQQVVPFAPWEIRRADLDGQSVRRILDRLARTGRLVLGVSLETPHEQAPLFPTKSQR